MIPGCEPENDEMMSLQEEHQMRQKAQADRANMPQEGHPLGAMQMSGLLAGAAMGLQDRPFSEEAHGFINLLAKLITRARWGLSDMEVVTVLRRAIAELEEQIRDANE